jgi:MFS family permease
MVNITKSNNIFPIYLFGFLFAFHSALPTYINSSFLNVFISEKMLGVVYSIASVFTIFLFFLAPFVLRKFGNYKTCLFLIVLEMVALIMLATGQSVFWLLASFIISLITIPFIYLSLDVFLEGFSQDKETGRIRGTYLTLANLAWIFSPIISSMILTNGDYWKIYLAALIFLIPIFFILITSLKNFKDSKYEVTSFRKTFGQIWKNKDIKNIFSANFLLNFFYSWMTIYTPLYLHKYAGFSWSEIGLIFGIMLLPFVFIQLPLGRIADKKYGEKEILSFGFIILAVATILLFFIPKDSSLWFWAVILFVTRIGAGSVEVMSDTYFFKKVNSLDTNIISFFRTARPLAYTFGPLIATFCLSLVGAESGYLFLILGLIMFSGLWFSLSIKDTK